MPDLSGNGGRVVYAPQSDNLGGAGGFSAGVKKAYELGAAWFWVMDDDVAVLPDGIEKLAKWAKRHEGQPGQPIRLRRRSVYWQYQFIVPLGIPNPIAPAAFGKAGYRVMNTLCFRGRPVQQADRGTDRPARPAVLHLLGRYDVRVSASKVTNPIVVRMWCCAARARSATGISPACASLNSTSDMNAYHIMRNRGYMARYFMAYGVFRPFLFAVGTLATAAKEVIRLVAVDREHLRTGLVQIAKGWWDSRKLLHDPTWQPMPPLTGE